MIGIKVTATGPLFRVGAAQIGPTMQAAIQELVELGEQRLDEVLRPRPAGVYLSVEQAGHGKASTGHYRRSVHAVVKTLHGIINDGNVVYGPWLEGTGSRNARSRFKGYQSFRKTTDFLNRNKRKVLLAHVTKLIRALN